MEASCYVHGGSLCAACTGFFCGVVLYDPRGCLKNVMTTSHEGQAANTNKIHCLFSFWIFYAVRSIDGRLTINFYTF